MELKLRNLSLEHIQGDAVIEQLKAKKDLRPKKKENPEETNDKNENEDLDRDTPMIKRSQQNSKGGFPVADDPKEGDKKGVMRQGDKKKKEVDEPDDDTTNKGDSEFESNNQYSLNDNGSLKLKMRGLRVDVGEREPHVR